ncbi:regulatory protein RecX [Psychromonas sp. 14N.309.X.WAT.B.A12]|uniref:regulatory protein RecX n=1 Tax=unclassified Psychromonas TaxID=2614957 RepID=UPI0025B169F8|nr:regulatory protein RecX [Psychromonas sp. 14N.309.X.WAT.B.A12]MDN2662048.1 regulatory protein RecX [Psychromonas sp. 14N.309.X.WAT.B.A12]
MFANKPIKIAKDIEAVRRSAFWHLSRRDHSQAELLKKLQRKTDNQQWIEAVIKECVDFKYLDDQRFAHSFLRSAQNKGHGITRIKQDLTLKGINESLIKQAMQESEFNYNESAQRLLANKYHEAIVTQHLKQKAMGFLQTKGFSFDIINSAIEDHNQNFPTPTFNDLQQACELLTKKFKVSIDDQKQKMKAIRILTSHGYAYAKANDAIKLFNEEKNEQ